MRRSVRTRIFLCIAGAAGLWLSGSGTAWAGGGADFGSLRDLLANGSTGICDVFQINPCPKVPSITQAALQIAALGNNLPEMLLLQNGFVPGSRVSANNPAATDLPSEGTVRKFPTASTTPSVSSVLSGLTPLAFKSQNLGTALLPGTALAARLPDIGVDTLLYAVAYSKSGRVGQKAPLPIPDYVLFLYDDLSRTNANFAANTTVAKFTFPLRVLNRDGSQRSVPTTLNFVANKSGDCSISNVVGDFKGTGSSPPPPLAEAIGIQCAVVFSASPASAQKHAIFQVAVPLLVTSTSDPLYFYSDDNKDPITGKVSSNPVNSPLVTQGVYTAFEDNTGFPADSSTLGLQGIAIGLAPSAAPLCSDLGPGGCPPTPIPTTFPLCANLPVNNDAKLRPAVGAYYAMATSGETLLSAGLGDASTSTCSLF